MAQVVLVRHGETSWSAQGRHTSTTDLPLTDRGRSQAEALRPVLSGRRFAAVLVSPRRRARETAGLAGLAAPAVDPALAEWDYGRYEGRTTAEIRLERPGWDLWSDGAPGGESPAAIGRRVDGALDRIRALLAAGDVAVVAHGHLLRVLGARWVGLPVAAGGSLGLDPAARCVLGTEHGRPVLAHWNLPAPD